MQVDDHFLVLAMENSFSEQPAIESVQFRSYLINLLKQSFLNEKGTAEAEKVKIIFLTSIKLTEF